MNLTVDQMDVLNFRLTEVSLELLGNKFYDIFGRKCDTLGSLYRSKSGSTNTEFAADSDLVNALQVQNLFHCSDGNFDESRIDNIVGNYDYDSETEQDEGMDTSDSEEDDDGIIDNRLQHRSNMDLKLAKIINEVEEEYNRLSMCSESAKMKYFITNKRRMEEEYEDEYEICNRYHIEENARLMQQSDAFIKLIKYIKSDPINEFKMGEIAATILKVKDHISEVASSSQ